MFGFDWAAIGTILVAITIMILVWQTFELRHATYASAYTAVLAIIQNEDIRIDRQRLITELWGKDIGQWTNDEIAAAERVCHSSDTACIMIRHKMLPKEVLMMNWADSLAKSWLAAQPLVRQKRRMRDFPELWDDFEALGEEAVLRRGGKARVQARYDRSHNQMPAP